MTCAPMPAARSSAAARLAKLAVFASTRRILQFGQIALAMSRSSAVSCAQPTFNGGEIVPPFCSPLLKQPFAGGGGRGAEFAPGGARGGPGLGGAQESRSGGVGGRGTRRVGCC